MNPSPVLIRAAMVVDATGVNACPGALLMNGATILAAGEPAAIGSPPQGSHVVDLPDAVVIPGLVNAHCHLDLTHVGPMPFTGDFVSWVDSVRAQRHLDDESLAKSVRSGIELARAGGTAIIGDIAGVRSLIPIRVMREQDMPGVSYIEVFGLGARQTATIAFLQSLPERCAPVDGNVRLGVQPHAPYSCGPDVYRAAASLGPPVATHLAETLEELAFVRSGDGPLTEMLRRLGVWDESITSHRQHSIDHVCDLLNGSAIVAAHVNYLEDRHLEKLAGRNVTVAYCPRASAYFGHPKRPHPPHQYRRMMQAGVRVALGTDSILCLDTPDRISVLDEMRLLHRRDGVDPRTLLAMATIHGAEALGFDADLVTFKPGPTLGLTAVSVDRSSPIDPLRQALLSDERPRWIVSDQGAMTA